ncbi:MAG: FAD-dependent thymidylate synthase [Clostridiales bacterium]|nr:MAG: FAD-dependent thymidylate synthase [Clostridiales bacterium]
MGEATLKVRLLSHTPDGEKMIAAAAKLCYARADIDTVLEGLTPEKTQNFLEMLTAMGHESPLEHLTFTFGIENVSRALLAQITRHRIASFSVQSQRYVAEDGFDFILPPAIAENAEAKALYLDTMEELSRRYSALSELLLQNTPGAAADRKKAIEDARFILPNGCTTKMMVTMNARSLLNFFRLRCCNRAQWEIRALATQMLFLVRDICPTVFRLAGPPCISGHCPEGKMSCGRAAEMKKTFLGA